MVYYSRVSEKTNCCGIRMFSAVGPNLLDAKDQFNEEWFFHGLGVCVVSHTACIPCVHGWGFAHLHSPVPGKPWTSASPRTGEWGPLIQWVISVRCFTLVCVSTFYLLIFNLIEFAKSTGNVRANSHRCFFFNPVLFYKYIKNYPELSKGAKASKSNKLSQKLRTITHTHLISIVF